MITPEQIAKSGTEFAQQSALFCWASLNVGKYPQLKWMFAIKNEEKSGSVVLGAKAKQAGVKAGVADIFLPSFRKNRLGLFIEMKKPGEKQKPIQIQFQYDMELAGYKYVCCDHWEKAVKEICDYLS